jgi:O-antigen/teichoic acid export membrane protein
LSWSYIDAGLNLHATRRLYWIMMAGVGARMLEETISNVLKGLHKVKLGVGLLDSPRQMISLIVLLSFLASNKGLTLTTALLIYILATLPAIIAGGKVIGPLIIQQAKQGLRVKSSFPLLYSSLPYWGLNTLSILMASAPLWLVSGFVADSQAGLYGAAMQLTVSISFFLGVTNQVTPATMAALYVSGEVEELEAILRKTASWGLLLSTPALFLLFFFGKPILSILYGDQYSAAYVVLILLALGQYINAAAGSAGMLMQMSGRHLALLKIAVFWVIANLSIGAALAGPFGMTGIAASSCLAIFGQNVSMVVFVRRFIGVRTYAKISWSSFTHLISYI